MVQNKNIMTNEDINNLITSAQHDFDGADPVAKEEALAAMLMLTSGARSGEILKLARRDIDVDKGTFSIKEGKTHTHRISYMNAAEKKALADLVDGKKENDLVFSITMRSVENYVRKASNNPSLPLYAVRHVYLAAVRGFEDLEKDLIKSYFREPQKILEIYEYSRKHYNTRKQES